MKVHDELSDVVFVVLPVLVVVALYVNLIN